MQAIEATYEGGVFRLEGPLPLADGTRVSLLIVHGPSDVDPRAMDPATRSRTLAERFAEMAAESDATDEVTNVAEEHDRYLYGSGGPP